MKKINALRILAITIIATIGIISCSKDDSSNVNNTNSTLQRKSDKEIQILQDEFKNIMLSSEYITSENNTKKMATALAGLKDIPLDDRTKFEDWVKLNLIKTKFTSLEDAMISYDNFAGSANSLYEKYNSFYVGLTDLEVGEVALVLSPELPFPNLQTTSSPCQNYCMDNCEGNIDALNQGYAENMHNWHTPIRRAIARFEYWSSMTTIIDTYNGCMSSC
jgi:hypothetical protein